MSSKNVALVLGGGGARGIAHIGVIEELLERGYTITSISGSSMGALVGGIYATGHLEELKLWLKGLNRKRMFSLIDISFSAKGLIKGDKVMRSLMKLVPEVNIEDLDIPFAAVAADLVTGHEMVLNHGSLYEAIRGSISIPSVFTPSKHQRMLLVDGCVANPLPINRVERTKGDTLIAVDVTGSYDPTSKGEEKESIIKRRYKLMTAPVQIAQHHLTKLMCEMHRPDLLIELKSDSYDIFEFYKSEEITEAGRELARRELDRFESRE